MKAVLKEDIIVHLTERGDTEIGAIPPDKKGVGLERLRWTGSQLVDLADLSEMWVRPLGAGHFELHAIEVSGSQLVAMSYRNRKQLLANDGVIRLKTPEEIQAEARHAAINMLKAELFTKLKARSGQVEDQLATAYKLIYLLMYYAKTGNTQISAFIDELLPDVIDTFPLAKVRDEIKDAVHDMNQFMKKYYQNIENMK